MERTTTAPSMQTKPCGTCSELKPIGEFRRRLSGTEIRHSQCRQCVNQQARMRHLKTRDRQLHAYNQQINTEVQGLSRMAEVTSGIVNEFSGVEGFVSGWKAVLDRAGDAGKHYLVARGLQTVLKLIDGCNELRDVRPQPVELSDQDLHRTMLESVERIVQENPILAVSAARRLGWDVIPPPETLQEENMR